MGEAPKYRIVFERLRDDILAGKYATAEKFPSEEQLVRRFRVSRNTVRAALDGLKRAGIIETRNGSGTYLSPCAAETTGTIGLIVPGIATGEIFPRICAEITREARRNGFSTVFGDASSQESDIRTTQVLRLAHDCANQRVNGVILEPMELAPNANRTTEMVLSILEKGRIPVVLLDRDITDCRERSRYDLVGIDNRRVGYKLAKHLIERGAKSIHTLIRPDSAPTVRSRAHGVRDAVIDSGLSWKASHFHEFDPGDETLVRRVLARKADAVICGNDITAAKLIGTLARIGLNVPDDILVTGVDDVRLATVVSPRLTTIRQPCEEIAVAAVGLLIDRMRSPRRSAREILLDAELVVRESTTPASSLVPVSGLRRRTSSGSSASGGWTIHSRPRAETIVPGV